VVPQALRTGAVKTKLRLREDATATADEDGRLVLAEGHIEMKLGPHGAGLAAAMDLLTDGGDEEAALVRATLEAEGEQAILRLHMLLARLESAGWLARALVDEHDRPLATSQPLGHRLPSPPSPLAAGASVVLSRFAALVAQDGAIRLQTPRAPLSIVVHDPAVTALVHRLARPATIDEVVACDGAGDLSPAATRVVLGLLARARILVAAGEEEQGALAQWSASDLLMHVRSRVGGNVGGYGGTYPLRGRIEPLPAVKRAAEPSIALERPDLDALAAGDVPFTRVVEERRSVRAHDDARPITATDLGHFLYRCARVRGVFHDGSQELSSRPYPGGGAVYELELYPLVHRCEGIVPGLYHYDAKGHALGRVSESGPKVTLLLEYARRTAVMDAPPQVLIVVAARFGRAMWKYEAMAYALVLKDVGVLYQTMYLVATAMGLAPCSLGGGHAEAFSDVAGLDPLAETSVGEFVLGRPGPDAGATPRPG
jgi:SagB-type dehydrogenase family enzyme